MKKKERLITVLDGKGSLPPKIDFKKLQKELRAKARKSKKGGK